MTASRAAVQQQPTCNSSTVHLFRAPIVIKGTHCRCRTDLHSTRVFCYRQQHAQDSLLHAAAQSAAYQPRWCGPPSLGHQHCAGHRRSRCSRPVIAAGAGAAAAAAAAAPEGFQLALPQLVPAAGPWGVWTGLVVAGAFGMWSERTRLGKELSGALVATLAGGCFTDIFSNLINSNFRVCFRVCNCCMFQTCDLIND